MRPRAYLFILFFSLFAVTPLVLGLEKGKALKKVRLGSPSNRSLNVLSYRIGEDMGYYKSEGIDIEGFFGMKTNISFAGLKSEELDYITGDVIRAAMIGIPAKIIFVTADRPSLVLTARPEIKSIKDLKGRSIAVGGFGSSMHFFAQDIVRTYGLDPDKDITIISTGVAQKFPALLSGTVDAAMLGATDFVLAKKKGYTELMRTAKMFHLLSGSLGTLSKRIIEKKGEVKGMLRATLKGLLYIRENRNEVIKFMAKEFGIPQEASAITYDIEIESLTKDGLTGEEAIMRQIEEERKRGTLTKEEITPQRVSDLSLLKEVHRELGL